MRGPSKMVKRAAAAALLLLVLLMGASALLLTGGPILPGFLMLSPSASERAEVMASLRQRVERAYGNDLASVEVRYGRNSRKEPTYFADFRLKGIPLEFHFQPAVWELETHGLSPSALVDNKRIGGPARFVALARAFHDDFPGEETMYYVLVVYPDARLPAKVRDRIGRNGPVVVVYDHNWFWGDERPVRSLGVYVWDVDTDAWRLLHRGSVPDV